MNTVADQILKQFADNFAARVGEIQARRSALPGGDGAVAATAPAAPAPANELNGLALAWTILRNWVRDLFGRKTA
jgi:hypothetical protein